MWYIKFNNLGRGGRTFVAGVRKVESRCWSANNVPPTTESSHVEPVSSRFAGVSHVLYFGLKVCVKECYAQVKVRDRRISAGVLV